HRVAEVFEHNEVLGAVIAEDDLVDRLDAAGRTDAAGRALAAGFDRAEFHGEPRLPGHVDGVVEDDDPAMANQAISGRERLIVERRIEQSAWKIGAERAADLHGAHWTTARRATTDIVNQFAERDTEGGLKEPAIPDIASDLDRHRATRAAHAEITIGA